MLPDLGRQILLYLEQEPLGVTRSQLEEKFRTSKGIGQSIGALERRGLVQTRYRARGGGPTPIRFYVRTARPVNDQLKITVFITPPAEA